MRLSLSQGATTGLSLENSMSGGCDDRLGTMAEKVMQNHLNAIKETYMLLNRDAFEKTIMMFEKAARVCFFGVGDSLLIAEAARNRFLRVTGKVECVADPHMQAMEASLTTPEDLIVMVSYSGATKDNIYVAKVAKQAGAKIVCITHFQKSPLTVYADAILLCGSSEGPLEGGSMTAKLSQLYLIDLLYQEYYERNYKESKINNEKTSRAVVEKLF